MANDGWVFWRLTLATDDVPVWLGATRPDASAAIDRQKVWTLIPQRLAFVANWFITQDHWRPDGESMWVHEQIDLYDARDIALEVPEPSMEEMALLTRPEACLTLDQINRHPVEKLLGQRAASALIAKR